jgi:hypothetical protein
MADVMLTLDFDAKPLIEAISELKFYIDGLSSNISDLLVHFIFDGDNFSSDLICNETRPAPDMRTQIVFFKPSNLFLDLLSACRAGNLNDFLIKTDRHLKASIKKE